MTPAHIAAPVLGAAPRIGVEADGFSTERLPAVSRDGSRVLLAIQDGDGGRGYPNLRLELRDRGDKIVATEVVLGVEEGEGYLDEPAVRAKVAPRIKAANVWLGEQHRALAFVPLDTLHVTADPDYGRPGQHVATAGDITLDWNGARLQIAEAGATVVERQTPGDWHAEPRDFGGGFTCSNDALLAAAAVDLAHRIAVVDVGYTGTDSCWEPNDQHHVVAW